DHNIRMPGEAMSCLKVPELGAIPSASESLVSRLLVAAPRNMIATSASAAAAELVEWQNGSPLLVDSFRAAMASLLLSPDSTDRLPATVITSVGPDEGKSTILVNLGLAMAE